MKGTIYDKFDFRDYSFIILGSHGGFLTNPQIVVYRFTDLQLLLILFQVLFFLSLCYLMADLIAVDITLVYIYKYNNSY